LRVILDNSAAAITMTDEKERIISWNSFTEQLLGMTLKIFKQTGQCFISRREWKNIRSLNIRQSGFRHHLETKAWRKDGTVIDVDLSVNILKDDKGKVTGSVGMMQEITEQNAPGNDPAGQARRGKANNAKSVFLAKMSHEVRTPMNALSVMIDITLDTPLTEEQKII